MRSCATFIEARKAYHEAGKLWDQEKYEQALELYTQIDNYFSEKLKSEEFFQVAAIETFVFFPFSHDDVIFGKCRLQQILGNIKRYANDEKTAIDYYSQAVKRLENKENNSCYSILLAELYFSLNQFDKALSNFKCISEFSSDYLEALCYIAFINFSFKNDIQNALTMCNAVIEKKSSDLNTAYTIKANILLKQGKYKAAEACFLKAIETKKLGEYDIYNFKRVDPDFLTPSEGIKYIQKKYIRDVPKLLKERLQNSVEVAEQEIKSFEKSRNESSMLKEHFILMDVKERMWVLQKKYLDACLEVTDKPGFLQRRKVYLEQIETLKGELYKGELDKVKARLKDSKEISQDRQTLLQVSMLASRKETIDRCAEPFINFIIDDEESLEKEFKKWITNQFKNRKDQQAFLVNFDEWALKMAAKEKELNEKFKKLKTFQQAQPDSKSLSDYLCDESEINRVDHHGLVPLHYACMSQDKKLALQLIDRGANIHIKNFKYNIQDVIYTCSGFLFSLHGDKVRLFRTYHPNASESLTFRANQMTL